MRLKALVQKTSNQLLFGVKLLASSLVLLTSVNAGAATFEVTKYADSEDVYIEVDGPIEQGDLERLKTAYKDPRVPQNTTLIMHSPGGDGEEMVKLIEYIKQKRLNTRVTNNSRCMSACAYMWLAGNTKYSDKSSVIGFHVSSASNVEYFKQIQEAYGYFGIQEAVQTNVANDIEYIRDTFWSSLKRNVEYEFIYNISTQGGTGRAFYTPSVDELEKYVLNYVEL